jgi:2-oxoglutarate dehydrogenase E1 component
MKGYRYYLDTELLSPNSMGYVENCYEETLLGTENHLTGHFDLSLPSTMHRQFCESKRGGYKVKSEVASAQGLIDFYRSYGHLQVNLGLFDDYRVVPPLPKVAGSLQGEFLGKNLVASLQDWKHRLSDIYINDIGYEFMYCQHEERNWLIGAIESDGFQASCSELKKAYADIVRAVKLEGFLGVSFVGQKRFSLEGCEGLVPMIECLISDQLNLGYNDAVIGMPHRGRINTLVNVMGIPLNTIYEKFDGSYIPESYSGDVKYHLGHSVDRVIADQHVHIALGYNPSHLEAINSVVMGNVRARMDNGVSHPYAIIVHGDAAVAGQGVVMETLSMSGVDAYNIGGSFHIVVNNQIGFTTNPRDSRSTTYCTDIAKMISAPVFHVRSDDLKSMIKVVKIAAKYRDKFKKDVFIDLVGHRKYGHNEADEPRATQPMMYEKITANESILEKAKPELIAAGIPQSFFSETESVIAQRVENKASLIDCVEEQQSSRELAWQHYQSLDWQTPVPAVLSQDIQSSAQQVAEMPSDIILQRQVGKLLEKRQLMADGKENLNWGMAELVAYQYLINQGCSIRLIGQDSIRGTFAHRHAAVFDQKTGEKHGLLKETEDAKFHNYNSILSEYAALGYEYGYAETDPKSLVIFEAQFGDFINGAQIIIDQFISSGYQKWKRCCGLVMLLPHGYEGQGPEHSSARLERFLQLASEDSIQVCVPSTAAQIFRLLVRQALRPYRRPLIVMSPKSLLRLEQAGSNLESLTEPFKAVIDDESNDVVRRLLLCSGKVYYDIKAYALEKEQVVHCVRIEQLYPFPKDALEEILAKYSELEEVVWCQEEPKNQGGWSKLRDYISEVIGEGVRLSVCARADSASSAVGYMSVHQKQQDELMRKIFLEDKS